MSGCWLDDPGLGSILGLRTPFRVETKLGEHQVAGGAAEPGSTSAGAGLRRRSSGEGPSANRARTSPLVIRPPRPVPRTEAGVDVRLGDEAADRREPGAGVVRGSSRWWCWSGRPRVAGADRPRVGAGRYPADGADGLADRDVLARRLALWRRTPAAGVLRPRRRPCSSRSGPRPARLLDGLEPSATSQAHERGRLIVDVLAGDDDRGRVRS